MLPSDYSLGAPATLQFDINGPNYEKSPFAEANGNNTGSIQPFFPNLNFTTDPLWQRNFDGSDDYNGTFLVLVSVTNFLTTGNNTFAVVSGRPDDHYYFQNVIIQYAATALPETSSFALLGLGLPALGLMVRRRVWK